MGPDDYGPDDVDGDMGVDNPGIGQHAQLARIWCDNVLVLVWLVNGHPIEKVRIGWN